MEEVADVSSALLVNERRGRSFVALYITNHVRLPVTVHRSGVLWLTAFTTDCVLYSGT